MSIAVQIHVFNSLILEIHINRLGLLPQLCNAFQHLLNLTNKYLFSLRMPMVVAEQIREVVAVASTRYVG